MNIFIILFACLSYAAILFIVYTITWGWSRHLFAKVKIYYEILLGFGFGVVSLFGVIVLSIVMNDPAWLDLTILLPIFIFWVTLVFISIYSSIGVLIGNMLSMFLLPKLFPQYYASLTDTTFIILVSVAYSTPLILYFINQFLVKISKWSIWSLTTITSLLTAFFATIPKIQEVVYLNYSVMIVIWLAIGYVMYGLLALVEQIYVHALRLENVVRYDDNYYLNQSSAHPELLKKISQEKISYGMYVTYFIKGYDILENKVDNVTRENIISEFATSSYQNFHKIFPEAVFFKPNYKTYGMFVPIHNFYEATNEEKRETYLSKIEHSLSKVKNKFIFDHFKITLKINAVISVFGIDSANLESLFEFNDITNSKKLLNARSVVFADAIEIVNEKNKNRKLAVLNEIVTLNNATSYFESIYNLETQSYLGFYIGNLIDGNEISSKNFANTWKNVEEYGVSSLLKRYLAMNAIKDIRRNQIEEHLCFIEYDANILANRDFETQKFLNILKRYQITLKNIVLTFDANQEIYNLTLFKKNISILKKVGIKVALKKFGSEKNEYVIIPACKPEYLLIDELITTKINNIKQNKEIIINVQAFAKKIEAKLIATQVNSYMIYKTLKDLKINLFFGELIGLGTKPKVKVDQALNYLLIK